MASIRKRTTSSGSTYHVQIRKKGYPPITKSFGSRATALAWAKRVESEIDRYIYLDISAAQRTTVNEVLDRYSNEVLPTQKGGDREKSRIKTLSCHLGKLYLADLKPFLLSEYRDIRLGEVSPSTVRKELGLLSRTLTATVKDWGIDLPNGNPVSQIRLPAPPAGRDRRLSKEEETTLLSALHKTPTVRTIMLFALETAMRRGEILGMVWDHIDLKKRTLLIPKTKTDIPRTIPLSERAIELLVALPNNSAQVFQITPYSVTQAFRRACRRQGIDNLRFHDLRHEATTRLFEKGLNPVEVASITGHRDTRMLMRYTHLKAEDLALKLATTI